MSIYVLSATLSAVVNQVSDRNGKVLSGAALAARLDKLARQGELVLPTEDDPMPILPMPMLTTTHIAGLLPPATSPLPRAPRVPHARRHNTTTGEEHRVFAITSTGSTRAISFYVSPGGVCMTAPPSRGLHIIQGAYCSLSDRPTSKPADRTLGGRGFGVTPNATYRKQVAAARKAAHKATRRSMAIASRRINRSVKVRSTRPVRRAPLSALRGQCCQLTQAQQVKDIARARALGMLRDHVNRTFRVGSAIAAKFLTTEEAIRAGGKRYIYRSLGAESRQRQLACKGVSLRTRRPTPKPTTWSDRAQQWVDGAYGAGTFTKYSAIEQSQAIAGLKAELEHQRACAALAGQQVIERVSAVMQARQQVVLKEARYRWRSGDRFAVARVVFPHLFNLAA